MITVLRPGIDLVPVEFGNDVVVWITPLTFHQKNLLASMNKIKAGKEIQDVVAMGAATLRFAIKQVDGVRTIKGPFKVKLDETGKLDDYSMEMVLSIGETSTLLIAAARIFNNLPSEDKPLEGVKINLKNAIEIVSKKKKH